MGWLDRIFGGKKEPVPEETTILSLAELSAYFDKKVVEEFAGLLKSVNPRLNEIRALQDELAHQLSDFRKRNLELEEGHARLRKIVESSKRGFLSAMDQLLQKTRPPEPENFESLVAYASHASALLEKEVLGFQKNIIYTGLVMKREMKEFGQTLEQFQQALLGLRGLLAKSRLNALTQCRKGLGEIEGLLAERKEVIERLASVEAQLASLQAKADAASSELSQLQASPDLNELEQLKARREKLRARQKDLKNRLQGMLAYVDRPLRRFLKLVQAGNYSLEKKQEKILDTYLEDPFTAIKQDPEAKALKKLLSDLKPLLESDRVGLKDDRERERRLAALHELLGYDFFTEIFSKFNALEEELAGLEQRIVQIKLGEQIEAREKWLQGIEGMKAALSREREAERAKCSANEAKAMAQKAVIEQVLLSSLRQRIVIKIELQ